MCIVRAIIKVMYPLFRFLFDNYVSKNIGYNSTREQRKMIDDGNGGKYYIKIGINIRKSEEVIIYGKMIKSNIVEDGIIIYDKEYRSIDKIKTFDIDDLRSADSKEGGSENGEMEEKIQNERPEKDRKINQEDK